MKILIACKYSGTVRDAFIKAGHDAISCDLLESDAPGPHYHGDVRDILTEPWDAVIAFPDCTYLCGSGWHWVARGRIEEDGRPRMEHVKEALEFARMFIDGPETAHIPKRAVENPIGRLSTLIRKPDQIIQPWQFGDNASKATCLWLSGLPLLTPLPESQQAKPRIVNYQGKIVSRWANQTDSGQNVLPPTDDRWKIRSRTYKGIAEAMASQWGAR
jgi:hypothetical protein